MLSESGMLSIVVQRVAIACGQVLHRGRLRVKSNVRSSIVSVDTNGSTLLAARLIRQLLVFFISIAIVWLCPHVSAVVSHIRCAAHLS